MWNLDSKHLQNDEVIEYIDHPNMLSCILSYIWVGFIAFDVITILISSFIKSNPTETMSMILACIALASPGIYIILKRLSTRYAISNRRLLSRTGIITNNIKSVSFKHITSIEVKESMLGKIFKYAHILIETSGSGQAIESEWKFVTSAYKVKKLIEAHVDNEG